MQFLGVVEGGDQFAAQGRLVEIEHGHFQILDALAGIAREQRQLQRGRDDQEQDQEAVTAQLQDFFPGQVEDLSEHCESNRSADHAERRTEITAVADTN